MRRERVKAIRRLARRLCLVPDQVLRVGVREPRLRPARPTAVSHGGVHAQHPQRDPHSTRPRGLASASARDMRRTWWQGTRGTRRRARPGQRAAATAHSRPPAGRPSWLLPTANQHVTTSTAPRPSRPASTTLGSTALGNLVTDVMVTMARARRSGLLALVSVATAAAFQGPARGGSHAAGALPVRQPAALSSARPPTVLRCANSAQAAATAGVADAAARRYWDGMNRRDVDFALEQFSEDIFFQDMMFSEPIRGKAELREHFDRSLVCVPSAWVCPCRWHAHACVLSCTGASACVRACAGRPLQAHKIAAGMQNRCRHPLTCRTEAIQAIRPADAWQGFQRGCYL